MTEWQFWGDRKQLDVYENIYLRTFVKDWFEIVLKTAREFIGNKFLDVGCGEGHTTKQILDRLNKPSVCDLLEPNKAALLSAKKFLKFENNIGETLLTTLKNLKTTKRYDTIFTSHTNYYWADKPEDFNKQLIKFILLGKRALILTLPESSDHYKIMLKQVYPGFNYAENIVEICKQQGFKTRIKKFKMRMFIGDILTNKNNFDLFNFYKFIHNINKNPSIAEGKKFLRNIKRYQRNGYLDFKDQLIIINN